MLRAYTAKYTKISSGYMGQVVEWPEVLTEGKTIEECREMLQDALHEMIMAYHQQNKEILSKGIAYSIELQPTNYANKLA
jgi:predicted RNase H-like HicB family nuclease